MHPQDRFMYQPDFSTSDTFAGVGAVAKPIPRNFGGPTLSPEASQRIALGLENFHAPQGMVTRDQTLQQDPPVEQPSGGYSIGGLVVTNTELALGAAALVGLYFYSKR